MADQYERDPTEIAAAKILRSLRSRKLVQWPDWLPRPFSSTEEPEEERVEPPPPLPLMWPKRQRANGRSKAGNAWLLSLENLFANTAPSASCGEEDGPAKRKLGSDGGERRSPAKHARVDGDRATQEQATSAAEKVEEPKKSRGDDNRDEKGCLLFDLNEDAPCDEG